MRRLIGRRCKAGNGFSRAVLIGREACPNYYTYSVVNFFFFAFKGDIVFLFILTRDDNSV